MEAQAQPTMRAVVLHGPGDLRVERLPVPSPGAGGVRVAVAWGGFCGSDLSYWRHGASGTAIQRHPLVLGHEIAGTVAELGDLGETVPDDFDVVFEASGVGAAVSTAIDAVRPGGVMVQVGNLPADAVQARLGRLVSREIDLRGSYRFVDEITDAVAALAAGLDIGPVASHEFGLDELEQAFATAADSRESCKVLLRF